jgi:hypothetical protein
MLERQPLRKGDEVLLPMEVLLDHFVADQFSLNVFPCRESVRPVSSPFA